jgi:hypothetical protein
MVRTAHREVTAVFVDRAQALRARDELLAARLRPEVIQVYYPQEKDRGNRQKKGSASSALEARPALRARGEAALGAMAAGILGGLMGTLLATGAFASAPPLFAGGALAGIVGALSGLVIGGFLGGMIGWALSADMDSFYAHEFKSGRIVLTVDAGDRAAEAAAIITRHTGSDASMPTEHGSQPVAVVEVPAPPIAENHPAPAG